MSENLIAGYAEYTNVDELTVDSPNGMATDESVVVSIIVATLSAASGASVYESIHHSC